MGASVAIDTTRLDVTPGSTATLSVRVRNTGTVVDQFTVDVVGEAAAFARVEPPALSLFPAAEGATTVIFAPPRSADIPAGELVIGIRVSSQEDPGGSVTDEVTLVILPFSELSAELLPRSSQGSRQAEHEVAIDNRGNAEATATVTAVDPDEHLMFSVEPPQVVSPPDSATFVKVRVRPAKRFLRGAPQQRPFQVLVEQAGQPPVVLNGTLVQQPVLPRWFMKAVVGALVGLALLALLWFALLKPTIRSQAREIAKEELAAGGAGISNDGGGSGGGGGGGGTVSTAPPTVAGGTEQPIDGRLFLDSPGEVSFTVPDGKVLQLTDIILQNPGGETGRLQVRRGDTPLLVTELANFRDLDYHFVAPVVFGPGQKLVLAAACTSPTCTPGAYFAGYLADA